MKTLKIALLFMLLLGLTVSCTDIDDDPILNKVDQVENTNAPANADTGGNGGADNGSGKGG